MECCGRDCLRVDCVFLRVCEGGCVRQCRVISPSISPHPSFSSDPPRCFLRLCSLPHAPDAGGRLSDHPRAIVESTNQKLQRRHFARITAPRCFGRPGAPVRLICDS